MTEERYFLIWQPDTDVSVRVLGAADLPSVIEESIDVCGEFQDSPTDGRDYLDTVSGPILIKGRIIVPKPLEKVTVWDVR